MKCSMHLRESHSFLFGIGKLSMPKRKITTECIYFSLRDARCFKANIEVGVICVWVNVALLPSKAEYSSRRAIKGNPKIQVTEPGALVETKCIGLKWRFKPANPTNVERDFPHFAKPSPFIDSMQCLNYVLTMLSDYFESCSLIQTGH